MRNLIQKTMKKKTKKEVLVELLPNLTYYTKQGNFKRKISMGRFIPDTVNYPNNKELSPAKIYDELNKLRLKENADDAGLMEIRSLIMDERKFVRLHQTWETKNLFENFMTIRSAHLLAYILDFIQIDKKSNLNVITFDKNILWKKYFFNCDSTYNNAINDLIFGGLISRPQGKRQAMTYYVNPNILSCGGVKPDDESEIKKKIKILTKKELNKKNIDSTILDVITPQSDQKSGKTKIAAYVEKSDNRSAVPFFKLYRNKFSKSLLNIKKKSSFRLLALITGQFLPEDDDNARLMREMIMTSLNCKKSNYYSSVADMMNADLIYMDVKSKQFKFNPNVWFNGCVIKLIDKRFRTHREIKKENFILYENRRLADWLSDIFN